MGVCGHLRSVPASAQAMLVEHARLGYSVFRASFLGPRLRVGSLRGLDHPQVRHAEALQRELQDEAKVDLIAADMLRVLEGDRDVVTLDLEKSFHCLHFIVAGAAAPTPEAISWAVLGRQPVSLDVGLEFGHLTPAEVREVSVALDRADFIALEVKSRHLPAADVYRWDRQPKEQLASWLDQLGEYYRKTAEAGRAMTMWHG